MVNPDTLLNEEQTETLIAKAFEGRKNSYSPYSHYRVGAAVLTEDGRIYTGCNIENSSYGLTNCAERTAIFKAVSEGCRRITAIAIVGGAAEEPTGYAFPCGACRQVIREFSNPETMVVVVAKSTEEYKKYNLETLLPDSFGPDFQTAN